jgi:hypothetical protein
MMELPINDKELEKIISAVRYIDSQLYAKLWSYKFSLKNKMEKR